MYYRQLSDRGRASVDLAGSLLFLIPVAAFIGLSSWDYVAASWSIREGSREAGGLPYPFVPLLKSLIPGTALLLILQGLAGVLRNIAVLLGRSVTPLTHDTPPEMI